MLGIINLHNGRISASSEGVDKGSTFVVELPVVQTVGNHLLLENLVDEGRDEQKSELCLSTTHTSNIISHGLCISQVLVVDDSSSNRKMLCR